MKNIFFVYSRLFFVCLVLLLSHPLIAQVEGLEEEVGIVEHLDTIIPANLTFNNETGSPVQLKSLITKPTILSLVYYDCPGICPQLLSGVSDVIEKMGLELGKDYQVITVSFNYDDTPAASIEKKKNFLRAHSKLHANDWQYLTGDSANIYALTHTVGYNFTRAGNDFMHPSCIMVLSPEGKVTRYLYGTTYLPFDVKMALIEAQKGQSRPTINRVLEYCFSYDPQGRKYTLQVTKITATIILFFALLLFIILIIRSSRKKPKTQNT
ncbi:MAG: SCO family protein [Bacteroidales bacterium]